MTLLKLEMKKNNLKPYILTANVIPFISLMFIYFLIGIGLLNPDEMASNPELGDFSFLMQLSFLINVAGFILLATAMLSKIVLESYTDNNVFLTFSYPISKSKMFYNKLLLCLGFCGVGVFFGIFTTNSLFYLLESMMKVLPNGTSGYDFYGQLANLMTAVILVISISLISLRIGWQKKSIALTVAMGIILYSLPSNLMAVSSPLLMTILSITLLLLAVVLMMNLSQKINSMEV